MDINKHRHKCYIQTSIASEQEDLESFLLLKAGKAKYTDRIIDRTAQYDDIDRKCVWQKAEKEAKCFLFPPIIFQGN